MMFQKLCRFPRRAAVVVTLAASLPLLHSTAEANVFASNIKLNGGTTDISMLTPAPVSISYILNEPATLGVKLTVASGTNLLRTLSFPAGSPGSAKGTNTVAWDGRDDHGNALPDGTYAINITAAASGYTNWTMISSDGSNNIVFEAYGIAVNRNQGSAFYGRVYVANSLASPSPIVDGERAGILKMNADGSPADEGGFSTGGYDWLGYGTSPWKVEVSEDDQVYVSDYSNGGLVLRFDPTLSTNSQTMVLRPDNFSSNASFTGIAIIGSGNDTRLLMADSNLQANRGIISWTLNSAGVCASNDVGTTAVASGGSASLDLAPFDVATDAQGNLYTCQAIATGTDPSARLFRFPALSAPGSLPITNADWAVGSGDPTYTGAYGVSVDPTGQFIAAAFMGYFNPNLTNGSTRIFSATNGALVAEIDLGVEINGEIIHVDTDCAWDGAGNVYVVDNGIFRWRIFSPPGTNQSTTLAPARVVVGLPEPQITSIIYSNDQVILTFVAMAGEAPSSFIVKAAPAIEGPYTTVPAVVSALSTPGIFQALLVQPPGTTFYRVVRPAAPAPPRFLSIAVAGSTVTLNFLGQTSDPPSAYTLLSAPAVTDSFSAVPGANIISTGSGVYQCTVATNGPARFYRIQR